MRNQRSDNSSTYDQRYGEALRYPVGFCAHSGVGNDIGAYKYDGIPARPRLYSVERMVKRCDIPLVFVRILTFVYRMYLLTCLSVFVCSYMCTV